MIGFARKTADISGHVCFQWDDDPRGNTARISRVPTLDGGAVINILGVSDGDRTIYIRDHLVTEVTETILLYLFNLGEKLLIFLRDGVYTGAILKCTPNNGVINMTVILEQKESE